jgi:hypothetical protein
VSAHRRLCAPNVHCQLPLDGNRAPRRCGYWSGDAVSTSVRQCRTKARDCSSSLLTRSRSAAITCNSASSTAARSGVRSKGRRQQQFSAQAVASSDVRPRHLTSPRFSATAVETLWESPVVYALVMHDSECFSDLHCNRARAAWRRRLVFDGGSVCRFRQSHEALAERLPVSRYAFTGCGR